MAACLGEMRKRGAAIAIYDVDEILTMTDGWSNQPSSEELKPWWEANRTDVEDAMCEGGRKLILEFVDGLESDDVDHDHDGEDEPGPTDDDLYDTSGEAHRPQINDAGERMW